MQSHNIRESYFFSKQYPLIFKNKLSSFMMPYFISCDYMHIFNCVCTWLYMHVIIVFVSFYQFLAAPPPKPQKKGHKCMSLFILAITHVQNIQYLISYGKKNRCEYKINHEIQRINYSILYLPHLKFSNNVHHLGTCNKIFK